MKSYKPLLPSSLRKLGSVFAVVVYSVKNLSEVNIIASKALYYSSDNHTSPSKNEQEVVRHTEKIVQLFELDKQNAKVYSVLSSKNRALKKQLEDYHSKYNSLKKTVKRLERDVEDLNGCVKLLDKYVDRKTVINLIQEIVSLIIDKKGLKGCKSFSYSSESSEDSDLVKIIERLLGYRFVILSILAQGFNILTLAIAKLLMRLLKKLLVHILI
ncbi:hypothetical protein C1645_745716 [Glomus cerebriforme]|uniref:Uncharacterized protein n=1 Tax=Glomus cerebriforme TaxID=658196 RepID=A0A397S1B3_9GLOM|nr:hypothetical protein C1645_745716 [Glomus cerebriforme]